VRFSWTEVVIEQSWEISYQGRGLTTNSDKIE